jgi:hypothetical protein
MTVTIVSLSRAESSLLWLTIIFKLGTTCMSLILWRLLFVANRRIVYHNYQTHNELKRNEEHVDLSSVSVLSLLLTSETQKRRHSDGNENQVNWNHEILSFIIICVLWWTPRTSVAKSRLSSRVWSLSTLCRCISIMFFNDRASSSWSSSYVFFYKTSVDIVLEWGSFCEIVIVLIFSQMMSVLCLSLMMPAVSQSICKESLKSI